MTYRHLSDLAGSRRVSAPHSGAAQLFCLVLLIAASVSASLVFACATPFAAFAVLAAATLPLRQALATIALVWAVNQAIGFGILDYPRDLNTMVWGAGILAAALLTTVAAAGVFRRFAGTSLYAVYPVALMAAYAVYEVVLLALVPVLGGGDGFTVEIVGNLAFVNAIWLGGLIVAFELIRRLNGAVAGQASGGRPL
jgi:hypothetical protein